MTPEINTSGLQRRAEEWAKKPFEVSEVGSLEEFWTNDALLIPLEAPTVSGTPALLQYYAQTLNLPDFHVAWKAVTVDLSADGSLGYVVGKHTVTVTDPEGRTHQSRGRDVSIWKKGDDGEWRWCVQTWNGEPSA